MSGRAGDPFGSDAAWSEARERARDEVRQALAGRGEPPASRLDPGMSPRAKRRLLIAGAATVIVLAVIAAILVPSIQTSKHHALSAEQRAAQATTAAERRRLAADQRPRAASVPGSHSALRRLPPARLEATLRTDLEASITADARARVRAHSLQGPIQRTDCSPFQGSDGRPPRARYSCTAVNNAILRSGATVGSIGYPFWAVVDFTRLSYTWCKVNPKPGEGEATGAAVVVPLSPRCTG